MIKFQNPEMLYGLALLLPFVLAFWLFMRGRRRALARMTVPELLPRLDTGKPKLKHTLKFLWWSLGFAALVVGLANPQFGRSFEKAKRQGVDLMIALDISNSMLSEDVQPSRLERARQYTYRLVEKLTGDRVGLILFAGNAYLQMPLTTDYSAAKTFLSTASPELAATQGTALEEAISMARRATENGEAGNKTLLIISDGEETSEEELESALRVAREAHEKGMVIHTMGVGTASGGPIPIYRGGQQVDYKRDRQGSIVVTRLSESSLREIAQAGGGSYFRITGGSQEVSAFIRKLASQEKKDFEEYVFTDYEDQFQWLVGLGLFFLCLDFFLSEKSSRWFSGWRLFETKRQA